MQCRNSRCIVKYFNCAVALFQGDLCMVVGPVGSGKVGNSAKFTKSFALLFWVAKVNIYSGVVRVLEILEKYLNFSLTRIF